MVDVVSDQTFVFDGDAAGNWDGALEAYSAETEILVQGTASTDVVQTANGVNEVAADFTAEDMSASTLRMYINTIITPNMDTTNAIQIFVGDGTNTAFFTVVNSKTDYPGGWQDYFLDPSGTPTSGTVNSAAVTRVGYRINTASKPRNAPANGWYDNWRFGNNLEINSDTTEAIDFTDVSVEDSLVANKYDIIQNIDGVLFAKGGLILGNAASSKNCNLVSLNEQIVFIDRPVSTSLYKIEATQGTGNTDIDITGLVCKTVGATGAELIIPAGLNSSLIAGSTFISMGSITLGTGTITATGFTSCGTTALSIPATSCTWDDSGAITLTGSGSLSNVSISWSTNAPIISSSISTITDSTLVSSGTGYGIVCDHDGSNTSFNVDGNTFTSFAAQGGTSTNRVIHFTGTDSGSTITLNVINGGDTPSYTTDGILVNIPVSPTAITLTGLKDNTEVRVFDAGTNTSIDFVDPAITGTTDDRSWTFSDTPSNIIDIRIFNLGWNVDPIKNFIVPGSATSIPISQSIDRVYNDPA